MHLLRILAETQEAATNKFFLQLPASLKTSTISLWRLRMAQPRAVWLELSLTLKSAPEYVKTLQSKHI